MSETRKRRRLLSTADCERLERELAEMKAEVAALKAEFSHSQRDFVATAKEAPQEPAERDKLYATGEDACAACWKGHIRGGCMSTCLGPSGKLGPNGQVIGWSNTA